MEVTITADHCGCSAMAQRYNTAPISALLATLPPEEDTEGRTVVNTREAGHGDDTKGCSIYQYMTHPNVYKGSL
jgi:hypothetical protein